MEAMVSELPPPWRPRTRAWKLLSFTIIGTLALTIIADWSVSHLFLINATASLPNWAFVIDRGRLPKRGDYMFFDPPRSPLLARHFGAKPQMFGKIVYGVAGDVVSHDGPTVLINGAAFARMKPLTRLGEPLTPGATGVIPHDCYFAGSPHKDGFDSRYAEIGFVCRRQVIGVGSPIL
jgi:conjugal transfer pilin signal peptidase TrbI